MELCYRRGTDPVERFLEDAEALGYRAGPPRKSSDAVQSRRELLQILFG